MSITVFIAICILAVIIGFKIISGITTSIIKGIILLAIAVVLIAVYVLGVQI